MAQAERQCPHCGEVINVEAVACRFCGKPVEPRTGAAPAVDAEVILDGTASGLALVGPVAGTVFGIAVLAALTIAANARLTDATPRQMIALGSVFFAALLLARLLFKWLVWKNSRFKITTECIETESGVLRKSVRNIDLWRVQDLSLSQTLIERVFGHGRILIASSDKDSPSIALGPISGARACYERVKRVQMEADRRKGVMHVQQ